MAHSTSNGNRKNLMGYDEAVDEKGSLMVASPVTKRAEAAFGHFAETTTFGGVIHTYLSPHSIWKAIWVVIVLGLLAATIWNTTLVVQDYLSYPVSTKVTVSYEPSVPFPTVTVCNRNPIQCLKLAFAYIKYPEELNDLFRYSNCFSSVSLAPLVYRLFLQDKNASEILEWRNETYTRILEAIEGGQSYMFHITHSNWDSCYTSLEPAVIDAPNNMEEILKTLVETCGASLAGFLFPDMNLPAAANFASTETLSTTAALVDASQLAANGNLSTDSPRPSSTSTSTSAGVVNQQQPSSGATTGRSVQGGTLDTITTNAALDLTTEESLLNDGSDDYDYYMEDFSFADAPSDIYNNEQFVTEFTEIAKDSSRLHLLREILDSYDEFIVTCTYFGKDCLNKTEFVLNYVPSYGSCFSFNSAFGDYNKTNNASGSRKAYLTGSIYGLSLEVLLDQDNYLPASAAAGAGARVIINPPGIRPNPSDEGYHVKPNTEADLSLRLLKVTRLANPYASNCWDDWGGTNYKPLIYNPEDNTTAELKVYSYAECRQVCSSYLLAQHCKCVDAHNPQPFLYQGKEVTGPLKVCHMTNKTDADCRQGVLRKMETDDKYECSCNLPCQDNQYIATASTSEWPSDMYMNTVLQKHIKTFSKLNHQGETSTENGKKMVSRELVRTNVYMQTLNLQKIAEEAKYDFFQLLSDLGDALGLYLGFCGITLFEILELLILMIMSFFGFNIANNRLSSNELGNKNWQQRSPQQQPSSVSALFLARARRSSSNEQGKFFDGDQDQHNMPAGKSPAWQDVPKLTSSRVAFMGD